MTETMSLIKKLINDIRQCSSGTVYLFGSTLRNFLLSGKLEKLDIIVDEKDKDAQCKLLNISIDDVALNFIFRSDVDYSHEFYTIDNIYAIIDTNFSGNIKIQSTNNGLVDLNKKIIKLTKAGKNYVHTTPQFILDTITLVAENKFILDSVTISVFMQEKCNIKNVNTRKIYEFFKSIVCYDHPRKIVSLINTLGISKELFNIKLTETSIVNHLKPDDYCEFIAVIFSDIEPKDFRRVLMGFPPKDIDVIKNIAESIQMIKDENIETAKNILAKINGLRVQNMIRLMYAMKFKCLAKFIRYQKCTLNKNKLCINEDIIKTTFKIDDDEEVKQILEKITDKVTLDPTFNDKYKILSYINNERE